MFDVIIAGGGPAGLNAALMLGRVGRPVLLADDGQPRNAPSAAVHGFLSRDGADQAAHLALNLARLGCDIIMCTNGPSQASAAARTALAAHQIRVCEDPV